MKIKHWARHMGLVFGSLPWRLCANRGAAGLECFASWFQEALPDDRRRLNFHDVTLSVETHDGRPTLQQVSKRAENNCYQHIDMELGWRASDHDRERMGRFLKTSFELLGLLNFINLGVHVFLRGKGGNAKSMLATLRHNVAGGNHFYVSSTDFTKPDEFRTSYVTRMLALTAPSGVVTPLEFR